MITLLLVILLLALVFRGLPGMSWNANRGWGYWPSGLGGFLLLVLLVLFLTHRI